MAIGLMGRACLWEMAYFTLRGDQASARRRRVEQRDVPVAGIEVPTFYHRTADLAAALGEAFRLEKTIGIGVCVPPPYLEPRWQQVPDSLRHLASAVDRTLGAWPLMNQLGDHTLTRWVKRP